LYVQAFLLPFHSSSRFGLTCVTERYSFGPDIWRLNRLAKKSLRRHALMLARGAGDRRCVSPGLAATPTAHRGSASALGSSGSRSRTRAFRARARLAARTRPARGHARPPATLREDRRASAVLDRCTRADRERVFESVRSSTVPCSSPQRVGAPASALSSAGDAQRPENGDRRRAFVLGPRASARDHILVSRVPGSSWRLGAYPASPSARPPTGSRAQADGRGDGARSPARR